MGTLLRRDHCFKGNTVLREALSQGTLFWGNHDLWSHVLKSALFWGACSREHCSKENPV
jgi:hypothetical protein